MEFFKKKGHKEIPNASLVPKNDPTVLFTTAGMHPLVPYLSGQKHPLGKRLVNVQKCIRTGDIEEVGDSFHHTFFEMLGNWSLGDYWKKEAIEMTFEFFTKELKIPSEKLSVTCFSGEREIPKDEESEKIWKGFGIKNIKFLGKKDNWWGPAGKTGPCGPDTEAFVNGIEIGNNVLMEYVKDERLILADGMQCLYDKDFKINKELLELINGFNAHTILAVNGAREKGFKSVKNYDSGYGSNWKSFSLEEEGIKKDDKEYFKILLKKFNLVPKEVIYFDHDKKSVEIAQKSGILSMHFKDVGGIKKFIDDNLYFYKPAEQKNIDFGGGVERIVAVLNGFEDNYLADMWKPIIEKIELLSVHKYEEDEKVTRAMRIVADHIKAAVFIINDGVVPGNSEQGYVLRRLIRRAIRFGRVLGIELFTTKIADVIYELYDDYKLDNDKISLELQKEEENFLRTLEQGLRIFERVTAGKKILSGKDAFLLYQSYGFPIEMTIELAKEKKIKVDEKGYLASLNKHQELSRTSTAGKFKSGLADNSGDTTKLHTATHLLLAAMNKILEKPKGMKEIEQRGSNITSERARFDFSYDRKLTDDEVLKIEDMVNSWIATGVDVDMKEMSLKEAKDSEANGVFEELYKKVKKLSVYFIGGGDISKEICTGPHVKSLKELQGATFKITKQKSVGSGVRRVRVELV